MFYLPVSGSSIEKEKVELATPSALHSPVLTLSSRCGDTVTSPRPRRWPRTGRRGCSPPCTPSRAPRAGPPHPPTPPSTARKNICNSSKNICITDKVHVVVWRGGGVSPGEQHQLGVAVHVVEVLDAARPGRGGAESSEVVTILLLAHDEVSDGRSLRLRERPGSVVRIKTFIIGRSALCKANSLSPHQSSPWPWPWLHRSSGSRSSCCRPRRGSRGWSRGLTWSSSRGGSAGTRSSVTPAAGTRAGHEGTHEGS